MKRILFSKYQGAGNDFVMVNGFAQKGIQCSTKTIARLCDRHFGIGGDGLIILRPHPTTAFQMEYYNADGKRGSFCGNGARSSVLFALHEHILSDAKKGFHFHAADGIHRARCIRSYANGSATIEVSMQEVSQIETIGKLGYLLNTGSPHVVISKENIDEIDVCRLGRRIRYDAKFAPYGGVNVNFYDTQEGHLRIRTYERGVEDETLACGTGITATAIVASQNEGENICSLLARGGNVEVSFFRKQAQHITDITLTGPASKVFEGSVDV